MEYVIKLYARDGTYKKTIENNLSPITFNGEINKGLGRLSLQLTESNVGLYKQSDIIEIVGYDKGQVYPVYSGELQEPSLIEGPDKIEYKLEAMGLWTIIGNYRMQNEYLNYPGFTLTGTGDSRYTTIGALLNMAVDKINELHEWSPSANYSGIIGSNILTLNTDNVDTSAKITVPNKFTSESISILSYLKKELSRVGVDIYVDATGTLYAYDTSGQLHKTTLGSTVNEIQYQGGDRTTTKTRINYSTYYESIGGSSSTFPNKYQTLENVTAIDDIGIVEGPMLQFGDYASYESDGGYESEPDELAQADGELYLQRSYENRKNTTIEVNNKYPYYTIQPGHQITVRESLQNIQNKKILQVSYKEYTAGVNIEGYDNVGDIITGNG